MNTESFRNVIDEDDCFTTDLLEADKVAAGPPIWKPFKTLRNSQDNTVDASTTFEHEPKSAKRFSPYSSNASASADRRELGKHAGGPIQTGNDDQKAHVRDLDPESAEFATSIQPTRGAKSSISATSIDNTLRLPVGLLSSPKIDTTLEPASTSCEDKQAHPLESNRLEPDFSSSTAVSSVSPEKVLLDSNLLREDVHPFFSNISTKISRPRSNKSSSMSRDGSPSQAPNNPLLSQEEEEDDSDSHASSELRHDDELREELPKKWILTLSMHFRDGTKREKFFITYMPEPNRWIRISVSVDYNHGVVEVTEAENSEVEHVKSNKATKTTMHMRGGPGSLEEDLETLPYQRDKNFVIYKAVYQSLEDIMFFPTITNLKIETLDDRLHIHVAEDGNEKIPYPPLAFLDHLNFARHQYVEVPENRVYFESHLSGFVYKVRVHDRICVKKEITSIDTVQEFLYEVEALAKLRKSKYVINLFGVVVGEYDGRTAVTGVLLEYASGGALNDFFYDNPHLNLDANTRMTWIRQVVQGMSDIHEGGYVQGDCTLSNVVIDSDQNAKIVDINRRGCPIGWEPPEFKGMIGSGQRISMFIGVKSDLYQLGMVMWAIWHQVEEPDRSDAPLRLDEDDPDIPSELRSVVEICLRDDPVGRLPAKELLTILKPFHEYSKPPMKVQDITSGVTRDDIQASQQRSKVYHRRGSRDMSEDEPVGAFFTQDRLDHKLKQTHLGGLMDADTNMMEAEIGLGAFADNIKEPGSPGLLQHWDSGLPDEEYFARTISRDLIQEVPGYEIKRYFAHQDSGFPQQDARSATMEDIDDAEPGEAEAEAEDSA